MRPGILDTTACWERFPTPSIRSRRSRPQNFCDALPAGRPMHDTTTLRSYVEEDLAILCAVKPDIVVGDFRISLAASAKVAKVPHVAIANAYWSPFGRQSFQFPEYDYPLQQVIGRKGALALFNLLRPVGFAAHTRPLNTVLKEHGLPGIGGDIRTMYTWGDYTAYADIPELVPTFDLPANASLHRRRPLVAVGGASRLVGRPAI